MKLILHYLKRYKKLLILNIISVFGFALVELGLPTDCDFNHWGGRNYCFRILLCENFNIYYKRYEK